MSRTRTLLAAAALIVLFFIANRGAYKGYFQDDDLDNLAWAPHVELQTYIEGLVSPKFHRSNFRPVGHLFYHATERFAHLNFTPYVAGLQIIHLLNAFLLWLLLKRLRFHPLAALASIVFFLFHPATFAAYWQPMYVFDALCATFCLLSLVCWIDRRWVLSFICFWLAYKAKEVAVMLPVVLAIYEYWLGQRRWKPLIPFFLVSLSFGTQALIENRTSDDAYTLKLDRFVVFRLLEYYGSHVFFWAWFTPLFLLLAFIVRDKRFYFGLLAACLFLLPMLILPDRMFSVYLYVPLIGVAVALATAVDRKPVIACLLFLAIWIPGTYLAMRDYRKSALTLAEENRGYVQTIGEFLKTNPGMTEFIQDGHPAAMNIWGASGAIECLENRTDVEIAMIDSPEAQAILKSPSLAILSWDGIFRKLHINRRDPSAPLASYVRINRDLPLWQFGEGWFPRENLLRWSKTSATATLTRPAAAREFETDINAPPPQMDAIHQFQIELLIDGEVSGAHTVSATGWQKLVFPLKPKPEGVVRIEFRISPGFHPDADPRTLGAAFGSFGFIQ